MGEWLVAHEYDAKLSFSQKEEMRVIGCLLYSNHFINRDLLTQAIVADEVWNPDDEENFGIFHLSLRDFKADNMPAIKIIFISTEVSRMEKMTNFFSSLYDGSAKRYPYCAPFLFVPLYRCNLSREFRAQLIRMHQDRVGESVTATTIKGWHSLDSQIMLQAPDGSTTPSTVKEVLLCLPGSPGMATPHLFLNIEPQVNSTFCLAVYAVENEVYMEERLKSLTKDINKLLAPGEAAKFFTDPSRGLSLGNSLPQYVSGNISLQTISPSSSLQLQRLQQMARSPSIKHNSPLVTPRSTRRKPEANVEAQSTHVNAMRTTAMTSYSGVTQRTNSTSYTSPTTSFASSTATHELSITIERRFESRIVSLESNMEQQQQQQVVMNKKLDSLDEVTQESNALLKQMLDDMKLTPLRGAKRDRSSGTEGQDTDVSMGPSTANP